MSVRARVCVKGGSNAMNNYLDGIGHFDTLDGLLFELWKGR